MASFRHGIDKLPSFPRTSLPYLQWLNSHTSRQAPAAPIVANGNGYTSGNESGADSSAEVNGVVAEKVDKVRFAQLQREGLQAYLRKLIRATVSYIFQEMRESTLTYECKCWQQMFGPGANRLCKFLEISSLSIALATKGGELGKQGYLRIMSSGASRKKASGFHPFAFKNRHEPKWFIVRDSYIVAVEDPASVRRVPFY